MQKLIIFYLLLVAIPTYQIFSDSCSDYEQIKTELSNMINYSGGKSKPTNNPIVKAKLSKDITRIEPTVQKLISSSKDKSKLETQWKEVTESKRSGDVSKQVNKLSDLKDQLDKSYSNCGSKNNDNKDEDSKNDDKKDQTVLCKKLFEILSKSNNKDVSKIPDLIKQGLEPDCVQNKDSAVPYAVAKWNLEGANLLIQNGATGKGQYGDDGILWWIAHRTGHGNYNSIAEKVLAKKVVNANESGLNGPALHHAAGNNNMELVKILLKYGADKNRKNSKGKTAADIAKESSHQEMALFLEGKEPNEYSNTIFGAAKNGNLAKVKELIAKGENVNAAENGSTFTPLIYASESGHLEVVKELIKAGANVNAKAVANVTALRQAAVKKRKEVIYYLLDKGANPNIRQASGCATGYSPFDWVLEYRNNTDSKELIVAMIKKGAELNDSAYPALSHILGHYESDVEFAKLLVSNGANVTQANLDYLDKVYKAYNYKFAYKGQLMEYYKSVINAGSSKIGSGKGRPIPLPKDKRVLSESGPVHNDI